MLHDGAIAKITSVRVYFIHYFTSFGQLSSGLACFENHNHNSTKPAQRTNRSRYGQNSSPKRIHFLTIPLSLAPSWRRQQNGATNRSYQLRKSRHRIRNNTCTILARDPRQAIGTHRRHEQPIHSPENPCQLFLKLRIDFLVPLRLKFLGRWNNRHAFHCACSRSPLHLLNHWIDWLRNQHTERRHRI